MNDMQHLNNIRHELGNCFRGGKWRIDTVMRLKKTKWDKQVGGWLSWETLGRLMDEAERAEGVNRG